MGIKGSVFHGCQRLAWGVLGPIALTVLCPLRGVAQGAPVPELAAHPLEATVAPATLTPTQDGAGDCAEKQLRSENLPPSPVPEPVAQAQPTQPSPALQDPTPLHQTIDASIDREPSLPKVKNPFTDIISLPLQNNLNLGVGPDQQVQNIFNLQPVVPLPLGEDLFLVTRTILPVIAQPHLRDSGTTWGLGDLNPTFFVVPHPRPELTWGVGPSFVLPTATDARLGMGKWSAGPAAMVLVNSGPWIYGGLIGQVWSIAGDSQRPAVSQFVAQPLIHYNLSRGWFLISSPVISANWNAAGEQWTLPLGGGVGRFFALGSQSVSASAQFYWYAIKPANAPDYSLRVVFSLLFPR